MTASLNDQAVLAGDALFIARVRLALGATCVAIGNEAVTTAFHFDRAKLAVNILTSIETVSGNMPPWVLRFVVTVSGDANVISDATTAGTVALTVGNVDTLQAQVTDAHINSAISGQFNAFLYPG